MPLAVIVSKLVLKELQRIIKDSDILQYVGCSSNRHLVQVLCLRSVLVPLCNVQG